MKQLILGMISIYAIFISPILKQLIASPRMCRYTPSCSAYTAGVINKYGVARGLLYGLKRFLSCQPFSGA